MTTAIPQKKCLYCQEPIHYAPGRGYVHDADGGSYRMYCPSCGWKGGASPSPTRCPKCGSTQIRDDHCASPDYGTRPT